MGGCVLYFDDPPPQVNPPPPPDPPDPPPPPQAISHTLFINFDDVILTPGNVDDATQNVSSMFDGDVSLSRYLGNDPQRAAKIAAIAGEISEILAPFDIRVATQRPTSGTYHMVVVTGATGSTIGLPSVREIYPLHCNTVPSGIALHIADGTELNQHVLAQHTIAMFGVFNGIPSSAVANDCMCIEGEHCLAGHSAGPCVISGANTPIADVDTCAGGGGMMDVEQRFIDQFGLAP
jgi:hypothetical protein